MMRIVYPERVKYSSEITLFVFQLGAALPNSIEVDETASKFASAPGEEEKLVLVNKGNAAVSLSRWSLLNTERKMLVLPAVRLNPNQSLAIVTGRGTPNRNVVYWRSTVPIWSDRGVVILVDAEGVLRLVFPYGGHL
jgi:hypothetical protein